MLKILFYISKFTFLSTKIRHDVVTEFYFVASVIVKIITCSKERETVIDKSLVVTYYYKILTSLGKSIKMYYSESFL